MYISAKLGSSLGTTTQQQATASSSWDVQKPICNKMHLVGAILEGSHLEDTVAERLRFLMHCQRALPYYPRATYGVHANVRQAEGITTSSREVFKCLAFVRMIGNGGSLNGQEG
ncbi:Hypothetical protein D9617_92g039730 [Elsinoe fawcettii]|nr:Hypothetical protein D9617_92g039730 [Elsinoe fawcettii]